MTPAQREEIKGLIAFYDERDWDWSAVVEFLVRLYRGTLPRLDMGRYRKRTIHTTEAV